MSLVEDYYKLTSRLNNLRRLPVEALLPGKVCSLYTRGVSGFLYAGLIKIKYSTDGISVTSMSTTPIPPEVNTEIESGIFYHQVEREYISGGGKGKPSYTSEISKRLVFRSIASYGVQWYVKFKEYDFS